jgi:hypothetical protein
MSNTSQEVNLAQTRKMLIALGVIKKPAKKKSSETLSGATGAGNPLEKQYHEAQGWPCKICNLGSSDYHLTYDGPGLAQINARIEAARTIRHFRPIQATFSFMLRN